MSFIGANPDVGIQGLDRWPGTMSYFSGADRSRWITSVPRYSKVKYKDLYPGIDLVAYWNGDDLEYDLVVHPGADPGVIRLDFDAAEEVTLSDEGDLIITGEEMDMRQRGPFIYQDVDGERQAIKGGYLLHETDGIGFALADFDSRRPLVIDPVIVYSTYLGGISTVKGHAVGLDGLGYVYVGGNTSARDFPVRQEPWGGAFVVKMDPTAEGSESFLGGALLLGATFRDMYVTPLGMVYVTGGGGRGLAVTDDLMGRQGGLFLSILEFADAQSSLRYSVLAGGSRDEGRSGMHVDEDGLVYLAWSTESPDIPMVRSFDPTCGSNGLCNAFETDSSEVSNRFGKTDVFFALVNPALPGRQGLVYSTYLGGSRDDEFIRMAVDGDGKAYLTGWTRSSDFPTTVPPLGEAVADPDDPNMHSNFFIAIIDPQEAAFDSAVLITHVGGLSGEIASDVGFDDRGRAYVIGRTWSTGFPLKNAFDTSFTDDFQGFVTVIDPAEADPLIYSSYVDGLPEALHVSEDGIASLAGAPEQNHTLNIPIVGGFDDDSERADFFVVVVDPDRIGEDSIRYSTYLGGNGSGQVWSFRDTERRFTSLRQSGGRLFLRGRTSSSDWPSEVPQPSTTAVSRGALAVINPAAEGADSLIYRGFVSGAVSQEFRDTGLAVDASGVAYLTGWTQAKDYPVTPSAYQPEMPENNRSDAAFLEVLSSDPGRSMAVSPSALAYSHEPGGQTLAARQFFVTAEHPTGFTVENEAPDWLSLSELAGVTPARINVEVDPTVLSPGIHEGQVTVTSIDEPSQTAVLRVHVTVGEGLPAPNFVGLVNAATFRYGAVAPGEVVSLFGVRMGPQVAMPLQLDGSGRVASETSGVRVLFDGDPAPLVFTHANQLGAVVPYSVAGKTSVEMVAEYRGVSSTPTLLEVADASPGIFALNASGSGPGAILNEDLSVNSPENPAQRGSVIVLFATGEGETDPPGRDGVLAGDVLPRPRLPVAVRVDGIACEVIYAGAAPGLVSGVLQVNARLHYAVPQGDSLSVELYVGDKVSRRDVTVAVQWPSLN